MDLLTTIRNSIRIQHDQLLRLEQQIAPGVVELVEVLDACPGRIIVTGMGKAGLIARKVAATLASIGLPTFFLHPTEATHGDLGVVSKADIAMCFSKSGETEELLKLLPHLKRFGVTVIGLTGNLGSSLAKTADLILDVSVEREADPLNLLPTASTTAMLVLGDALASALVVRRGLSSEEFSQFHPGGTMGRQLLLRVKDLMHVENGLPTVQTTVTVREAILKSTSKKLGVVLIVNPSRELQGIFTDGDLRRLLETNSNPLDILVRDVMTQDPSTVYPDLLAVEAIRIMNESAITTLPVVDENNFLHGLIHLHDLLRARLS